MRLHPIEEGELVLRELCKDLGLLVARAELLLHIRDDFGDALVARVLVEGLEKVELAVLLHLDAQVIELLDGRVAGKEVHGTRPEGDELQALDRIHRTRDGKEGVDHVRALLGIAHGVFGDVSLHAAQL